MNCRLTRALAMTLLFGSLGCAHEKDLTLAAKDEHPAVVHKETELAKRNPLPSTCVAFGTFSEHSAAAPRISPAEQERLRDQARKAYQQALELDPKDLTALTALARLYITLDDSTHAVATYRRAVASHPQVAGLWHEMGMCHARYKEWEPALESLRHAVELEPEQRAYTHDLGFCLARCGQYDESLAVFAKLEGEASAHYDVARMLHHVNQDELSMQHLRLALQLKPEMAPAQQLLASLEGQTAEDEPAGLPADHKDIR
jgi:tetratricopeptide (TPR) repeat protein